MVPKLGLTVKNRPKTTARVHGKQAGLRSASTWPGPRAYPYITTKFPVILEALQLVARVISRTSQAPLVALFESADLSPFFSTGHVVRQRLRRKSKLTVT